MGLQIISVPSFLSLIPPLRNPCLIRWLSMSICLCICQALAEPLTVISCSCQQAFLGIHSSVWVWWLYMGWILKLGRFSMAFPSVSAPHFVSHEYFAPPSKKDWSIHTLVFLLLKLHLVCQLDILSYWANSHFSVNECHVFIYVAGLPHSGYFIVP